MATLHIIDIKENSNKLIIYNIIICAKKIIITYINKKYNNIYTFVRYKINKKNVLYLCVTLQKICLNVFKFIKWFTIYLINKYYYKVSNIDFIITAYVNSDVFKFFKQLTTLKHFLFKEKCNYELTIKMIYYYIIMIASLSLYFPITWFLIRVLTDAQNWMIYFLEQMNLSMAL